VLLIGVDLDGTIAPLEDHPEKARVLPRVIELLEKGTQVPDTHVAIVSARPLAAIRRLIPVEGLHRSGQYGLEGNHAPRVERRSKLRIAVSRLAKRASRDIAMIPGAWIERKGLTVAVHDRGVAAAHRTALSRIVRRLLPEAKRLGFRPMQGSRVVDFVPAGFDKGAALARIRRAYRPDVTLYVGDSPSDEEAFRILGPGDFPVRVGRGPTQAAFRVAGPTDVARLLAAVIRWRTRAEGSARR
jgi:trehalose-phosphatase